MNIAEYPLAIVSDGYMLLTEMLSKIRDTWLIPRADSLSSVHANHSPHRCSLELSLFVLFNAKSYIYVPDSSCKFIMQIFAHKT